MWNLLVNWTVTNLQLSLWWLLRQNNYCTTRKPSLSVQVGTLGIQKSGLARQESQNQIHSRSFEGKKWMAVPRPPPLPPQFLSFRGVSKERDMEYQCVTKLEIARFWRQKQIEEEDHLLAAIKAAAIIRARNLKEEDYKYFVMSLENENDEVENGTDNLVDDLRNSEIRVGIKDWWTKSKYVYLNQPAIDIKEPPGSFAVSYIPNCLSYKPTSLYPTSVDVF